MEKVLARHKSKLGDLVEKNSSIDLIKNQENKFINLRKIHIDSLKILKHQSKLTEIITTINEMKLRFSKEDEIDLDQIIENLDLDIIEEYIFSEDISTINHGIFILRESILPDKNYTTKNLNAIKERFDIINRVFAILTFPDPDLKYDASWFLINFFSYQENAERAYHIFNHESNKKYFSEFYLKSESYLFINAIFIVSNIALSCYFIIDFFFEEFFLKKILYCLNNPFSNKENKEMIERITCLIANITKWNLSKYKDKIELLIPILFDIFAKTKKVRQSDLTNKILSESNNDVLIIKKLTKNTLNHLIIIFSFLSYIDDFKIVFTIRGLHNELISLLTAKNNIINGFIWKCLQNLVYKLKDLDLKYFIDAGIINSIRNYLSQDFKTFNFIMMKNVLSITSKLTCRESSILELLDIIRLVWEIVDLFTYEIIIFSYPTEAYTNLKSYKKEAIEAFKECINLIHFSIERGLNNIKIEILQACKVSISQLFIEMLKYFKEDIDLMIKILKITQTILEFEEKLNTLGIYNQINFNKEEFAFYGFQEISEEYKKTENKKLIMIINLLEEKIYS